MADGVALAGGADRLRQGACKRWNKFIEVEQPSGGRTHDHPRSAGGPRQGAGGTGQSADNLRRRCRPQALRSAGRGSSPLNRRWRKPDLSFICECKKASPSKGLIAPEFPYLDIARDYEAAGADAISVLTEPKWFLGSDQYLQRDRRRRGHPLSAQGFHRGRVHDLRGQNAGRVGGAAHLSPF